MERICFSCKQPKPLTVEFFGRWSYDKVGFKRECRLCNSVRRRKYRAENLDKTKAAAKRQTEKALAPRRQALKQKQGVYTQRLAEFSDLGAAYLAGIVDGEGTITVRPVASKSGTAIHSRIIVPNSDRELIEWIASIFGGVIYRPRSRSEAHKQVYVWYLSGFAVGEMCKRLMPYLRVKKRHAEILLEFQTLRYQYLPGASGRVVRTVPPEFLSRRAELLAEITALNKRGT